MPGQKGKLAKVLKAVTGTFYIIDFGDGPHKWYAEGELDQAEPLTKERIKNMSTKEINDNWALIQEVLKK